METRPNNSTSLNEGMGNDYEKIINLLRKEAENAGSLDKLASRLKTTRSTLSKIFTKGRRPNASDFLDWLEILGGKVVFPEDIKNQSREVCFVDAKIVGAESGYPQPLPEPYLAVPLADGPVAAGRGMVPSDGIKSWVLVFRNHPSVRFRSNLVAVEIGKGQESMIPLLHPNDIVLVDKDDFRPEPNGGIFLIREPDDSVSIKRVFVKRKDSEIMLNFVSQNPDILSYPPLLYGLNEHYGGDISRAIIGRCVWAWSDLTRK
ncbi:S24 family peptidase [Desulfovibrio inopinatus]|uniref:S24 family peptidase n=1 Tax=Desulfovibrio inopinatus TaxID=102109 RepID=UPI0003FB20A6|nr:S24 family peptidase [Desulfovibrio inopinatus]